MNKTEKEIAFLRDLYIETDYTERFTDIFDDNFKFTDEKTILYVNAGAGNHALALRKKLADRTAITGVSENQELLNIARHKADAVRAKIDFLDELPKGVFDAVIADASLTKPSDAKDLLKKSIDLSNDQVAFYLPTAGSFGEVFSLLWETFLTLDWLDKGAEVERLISDIPQVSQIEDAARKAGLNDVEAITKNEYFEYENGKAFIESPLVADFLMPVWLNFLSEAERETAAAKLAETIDEDCQDITFRVSLKATLLVGAKS